MSQTSLVKQISENVPSVPDFPSFNFRAHPGRPLRNDQDAKNAQILAASKDGLPAVAVRVTRLKDLAVAREVAG